MVAEQTLAALDVPSRAREYFDQNELLILDELFPRSVVEPMIAEAIALKPKINRNYIPNHKKGGSVSYFEVRRAAPSTYALYHSPALIGFLNELTGASLLPCPDDDPHACALYYYTESGDHIGYHYDTSFYKGARYTLLLGLVERSSSRLICQVYKDDPSRETKELRVATNPGTLVFFNGDKLWHSVSPLGEGEERIVCTMQYVTDPRMGFIPKLVSNVKDAVAYFGIKSVLRTHR